MSGREKVIALLEEALAAAPGEVTPGLRLDAIEGLDSMGIVQFLGSLSDHLGVVVTVEELLACRTVADVVAVVEGHLRSGR